MSKQHPKRYQHHCHHRHPYRQRINLSCAFLWVTAPHVAPSTTILCLGEDSWHSGGVSESPRLLHLPAPRNCPAPAFTLSLRPEMDLPQSLLSPSTRPQPLFSSSFIAEAPWPPLFGPSSAAILDKIRKSERTPDPSLKPMTQSTTLLRLTSRPVFVSGIYPWPCILSSYLAICIGWVYQQPFGCKERRTSLKLTFKNKTKGMYWLMGTEKKSRSSSGFRQS